MMLTFENDCWREKEINYVLKFKLNLKNNYCCTRFGLNVFFFLYMAFFVVYIMIQLLHKNSKHFSLLDKYYINCLNLTIRNHKRHEPVPVNSVQMTF